jgi:two-component system sensor histidine kinase BarA
VVSGISLANKCQLLFGAAVLVILCGALSVPWIRTRLLVRDYQVEVARQLADAWLADRIQLGTIRHERGIPVKVSDLFDDPDTAPPLRMALVNVNQVVPGDEEQAFLNTAIERFSENPELTEYFTVVNVSGRSIYRYARALRKSQMQTLRDRWLADFNTEPFDPDLVDPLEAILVVDRTSEFAERQILVSRSYIAAAGIVAGLLAMWVFYLILTKLILRPVRELRATTEKVQQGDLAIRSTISTGDEFEQLSDAFNDMLERVEQQQQQMRAINESLDLKVDELAEANVGLYESNRFKSEFLANISHELRTPLNSIIGFAELLHEQAAGAAEPDEKRLRYLQNILGSSRSLLDMINELLDMAKIEANRMEVSIEPTSVVDLVEGLQNIMRPASQAKSIELRTHIGANVPMIETDPGKLQQILYNFLSNAIKFTPEGGTVTISADRITRQDNALGVRLAVADTGVGIPYDMQDVIFEKFRQIDASHTREHPGTGLGLAICKELAEMLGASVSFVSEPGRGATFFVDLPQAHAPPEPEPLMG